MGGPSFWQMTLILIEFQKGVHFSIQGGAAFFAFAPLAKAELD